MFALRREALLLGAMVSWAAWPSAGIAQLSAGTSMPDAAGLSAEALDLVQAAQAIEDRGTPGSSLFTLYVGSAAGRLVAGSVVVQIDDANPVTYEYSQDEAACLRGNGLKRLLESGLTPGTHLLKAEIMAYDPTQTEAGSPRSRVRIEKVLNLGAAPAQYEVQLIQGSYLSEAKVELHSLDAATGAPDPHLRDASCLIAGRRYLEAAAELRTLQSTPAASATTDLPRLLGISLSALQLGSSGQVERRIDGSAGGSPPKPPLDADDYNRAVAAAGGPGRTGNLTLLQQIGTASSEDPDALSLRDQANLTLGYALLRQSRHDEALAAFQRIRTPGQFANAALLGLGWASLAGADSGSVDTTAAGALRVPLNPEAADHIDGLRKRTPFPSTLTVAAHGQVKALNRSLITWSELIGRDPLDPAVEEGMLAIPYALDHLGAHQEAEARYRSALDMLVGARDTLDAATAHVRSGGLLQSIARQNSRADMGWPAWVADLPHVHWWLSDHQADPSSAFYLQYLLVDDRFSEVLQNYIDLSTLADTLQAHRQRLCGSVQAAGQDTGDTGTLCSRMTALQARAADQEATVGTQLQAAALTQLQARKDQAGQYLVEAELALARVYDRDLATTGGTQ